MHEDLKIAVGIKEANCESCINLGTEGDGYEYNGSWPVCDKFERMSNLKSFPFKKEMKCWEPNFWASKFPTMIKTGSDEEVSAAIEAFREAAGYNKSIQTGAEKDACLTCAAVYGADVCKKCKHFKPHR